MPCGGGTWAGIPRWQWRSQVKFSELVRLLEANGFKVIKQKGSIRYYGKIGWDRLIRVDYHGAKEVPTGTCHSILKASGIKYPRGGH
ncbi:type II toxin-antitoxin system HicA family toxin [Dehalococcoidia bacterium]|nr:type II toxin-antitoxin system HicA family toxin [Dehalococcoidia bacterium]MCL0079396.1 type II toxin-antitoxin system HicA family toxin [Dehalococcoidia bacterium]